MNRKPIVLVLVVALLLLLALPVAAAGWQARVTGGGEAMAGATPFSITTSAWMDAGGNAAGQIQYTRSDLAFHAAVECMGVFDDGDVAVAAGPAWAQEGSIAAGAWAVVEINEGGIGSGDSVRVRLMSEAGAQDVCVNPSGSFPGTIYDGNFNIRLK